MLDDGLTGNGEFAIASYVGVHIDYDRSVLERGHCFRGDGNRGGPAEDPSRGDDDVSVLGDFADSVVDLLYELRGKWLGVTRFILEVVHTLDLDETASDRLYLLGRRLPDVRGVHYRTEALGGGDCLKAGNAAAHDDELGGLDRPGAGGHHRYGLRDVGCAHQHGLVAC